jgi:hypothetical protein
MGFAVKHRIALTLGLLGAAFLGGHFARAGLDVTPPAVDTSTFALKADMPVPAAIVPPTESPQGAVGTPGTYRPGNAVQPRITRSKTVTLDATGAATFDWTAQGALTMQVQAAVTPVFTGTGVPKCWVTAISSTSASIKCTLETVSLITVAGVGVASVTNGSAAGLQVGIIVLPTS